MPIVLIHMFKQATIFILLMHLLNSACLGDSQNLLAPKTTIRSDTENFQENFSFLGKYKVDMTGQDRLGIIFNFAYLKLFRNDPNNVKMPDEFGRIKLFIENAGFKKESYFRGFNIKPDGLVKSLKNGFYHPDSNFMDVTENIIQAAGFAFGLFGNLGYAKNYSPDGDLLIVLEIKPGDNIRRENPMKIHPSIFGVVPIEQIEQVLIFNPNTIAFEKLDINRVLVPSIADNSNHNPVKYST